MNRSVYSLVLMDDVVAAIDRMAARMQTSRSNLINQVLAQYASCVTPEMRMREIFSRMEELMDESLQMQLQPSEAMISIRRALMVKYRPTVRYQVELYRNAAPQVGEFRALFRTQSRSLLEGLERFFHLWEGLENLRFAGQAPCEHGPGRFRRQFPLPGTAAQPTNDALAEAIARYVEAFDGALKDYFAYADQPEQAAQRVRKRYSAYARVSAPIL